MGVLVKAAKEITNDEDNIEYIKSNFDKFEEVLSDKKELKQMIKHLLKLYINENINENKIPFDDFWEAYDKKVGDKVKIKKKWDALSVSAQESAMSHIPKYKHVQPDKKFRKNPETYINSKAWNDELITSSNGLVVGQKTESSYEKPRNY
jgi:hypothetical protein